MSVTEIERFRYPILSDVDTRYWATSLTILNDVDDRYCWSILAKVFAIQYRSISLTDIDRCRKFQIAHIGRRGCATEARSYLWILTVRKYSNCGILGFTSKCSTAYTTALSLCRTLSAQKLLGLGRWLMCCWTSLGETSSRQYRSYTSQGGGSQIRGNL